MVGRPSTYSVEIADKICEILSTSNKGLVAICKEEGMPSPSTVYLWLIEHKEFSDKYTRARELQADYLADEIIELSDTENRTIIDTENQSGSFRTMQDNHARTRIQVDARKWKASKLYPKKYGDKMDLTTDGDKLNTAIPQIVVYNSAPPLSSTEDEVNTNKVD